MWSGLVVGCGDRPPDRDTMATGRGSGRDRGDLGRSRFLASGARHDSYALAERAEHVDERLDVEQLDPPAHQVADARRVNAQQLRCGSLGELSLLECFLNLDQEIGPYQKTSGNVLGEADVSKHVSRRLRHAYPRIAPLPLSHLW